GGQGARAGEARRVSRRHRHRGPVRIVTEVHQFLSTFAGRDAIGMHTIRLRALLRDAGFPSDIYALDTHDDVRHDAYDAKTFRDRVPAGRDAWALYHFSIGS